MRRRRTLLVAASTGFALALLLGVGIHFGWLGASEERRAASDGTEAPLRSDSPQARDDAADTPTLRGTGETTRDPVDEGGLPPPVDLARVDRDLDLHGIVRRRDGTPVAGARLAVFRYPWRHRDVITDGGYYVRVAGPSTRSASDGSFSLRLAPGVQVNLEVSADGLASKELAQLSAGERVDVVLEDGVEVALVVRSSRGGPVEGAHVRAFRIGRPADFLVNRDGVTDANGRLLLEGLPGGIRLTFDVEHETWGAPGWKSADLPSKGTLEYEIVLPEGRTVEGRVTDAATGAPIAGARVGMNWVAERASLTDADGRYVVTGWTGEGVTDLHVLAEGYGRQSKDVGAATTVDFALARGFAIGGRIVETGDGTAVRGARVAAIASSFGQGGQEISMGSATSGVDGSFRVGSLRRDLPHTLVVFAAGHGRTLLDLDPPPAGKDVLELGDVPIGRGYAVAGRVVDADGVPVARVSVKLAGANDDRTRLRAAGPAQTTYGAEESRYTDDLGRFRFEDESPGTYELRVEPAGAPAAVVSQVVGEGDVTGITVVLQRTREIVLRARGDDGRPVEGLQVSARGVRSGRTDARGEVRLRLPPGPGTLQFSTYGTKGAYLPPPHREVGADETDVEIDVVRAGTIRGRVVDAEGRPVPGASLSVLDSDATLPGALANGEGAFELVVPRDRPVDVVFSGMVLAGGGSRIAQGPLRGRLEGVHAGDVNLVLRALELPRDRELDVRVLSPEGRPVEGAYVWSNPPWPEAGTLRTDGDGRVHVPRLAAESLEIGASTMPAEGRTWVPARSIRVTPDGQEITLRLRPGIRVEGVVRDSGGAAVGGCMISFQRTSTGSSAFATTEPDGTFEAVVDAEGDGPWRIVANMDGPGRGASRVARIDAWVPADGFVAITLPDE